MLELSRDRDLPPEPLGPDRGRELGVEHLQGDESEMSGVLGQINGGHAPTTQLALDPVALP
jgi:hypothetical protein